MVRGKHFLRSLATFVLAMLVTTSITWAGESSVTAVEKRVLIINSYHHGYKWSDDIIKAIQNHFTSHNEVELYIEYMDSKRQVNPHYWPSFHESIKNKYKDISFDVVISADNNAFTFVIRYRDDFLKGVPLVFCGYNNFRPEYIVGMTNLTGVNEQVDVKGTVDTILKIHPNIRKLIFYLDTITASATENNKVVRATIPEYEKLVDIEIWQDLSIGEFRSRLQKETPSSILLSVGRTFNEDGTLILPAENLRRIAKSSPLPVYSLWNFAMHTGVVGGKLLNGYDQGRSAAQLTQHILDGSSPDNIPVVMKSPTTPIFDYNALKKFVIQLERLPKNSIVLNEPFSFYETYKAHIWTFIVIFSVLSSLVFILMINVQHRKKTELALRRSRIDLEENIRELEKAKLSAEEGNRVKDRFLENMGHEIRTPMNAILGFSEMLESYIDDAKGRLYLKRVQTSGQTLLRLLDDILSISALVAGKVGIQAGVISPYAVVDELKHIYGNEIQQKGLELIVSMPQSLPKQFVTDESILRQILLKLLGNAVKFTTSGHIRISAEYVKEKTGNELHFSIEDTGPGIPPDQLENVFKAFEQQKQHQASNYGGSGLGLTIARQLAEMLDGEIQLISETGQGSTFTLTLKDIEVIYEKNKTLYKHKK